MDMIQSWPRAQARTVMVAGRLICALPSCWPCASHSWSPEAEWGPRDAPYRGFGGMGTISWVWEEEGRKSGLPGLTNIEA